MPSIRGLITIRVLEGIIHIFVPEAGLEPARFLGRGILNPLCIPISPLWHRAGL